MNMRTRLCSSTLARAVRRGATCSAEAIGTSDTAPLRPNTFSTKIIDTAGLKTRPTVRV